MEDNTHVNVNSEYLASGGTTRGWNIGVPPAVIATSMETPLYRMFLEMQGETSQNVLMVGVPHGNPSMSPFSKL